MKEKNEKNKYISTFTRVAKTVKSLNINYSLLFMPIFFIYLEIAFMSLQSGSIKLICILSLLIALIYGIFANLILILLNKYWKITIYVITIICSLIYMLESYLNRIFSTYSTLSTVYSMTGNVVNNYGNEMTSLIFLNLDVFIIYIIPIIVLSFLLKKMYFKPFEFRKNIWLINALIILFILYFGILIKKYNDSIREHTFNGTAHKYGISNAMIFDIISPRYFKNDDINNIVSNTSLSDEDNYNMMQLSYDTLPVDNIYRTSTIRLNKYVESCTPSKKNKYTGMFKGKNLIMICAESFYGGVVDEKLTPTLYRLMNNGFRFNDFYNALYAVCTSAGEYTFNLGMIPMYGVESMYRVSNNNNYFTMANQLKRIGYKTFCFHNGNFDYYNRHITHEALGYDYYFAFGNGLEKLALNRTDYELFDKSLNVYKDEKNFMAYYMTYDGHMPYNNWDSNFMKYNDRVIELYGDNIEYERKNYLTKLVSFDEALANLLKRLEEEGILDDTVICLTSDHYPYGLSFADNDSLDNLYGYKIDVADLENRDKNKAILWCSDMEKKNFKLEKEVNSPTCVIDILPTLSNLFGLKFDSRLMPGRDVFSDAEPLVIWDDYSFKTENFYFNHQDENINAKEGCAVSDEELQRYRDIVRNKVMLSKDIVNVNYFNYLFKDVNYDEEKEIEIDEPLTKEKPATYFNVVNMVNCFNNVRTMKECYNNNDIDSLETVNFGRYEQDNNIENGPEDIEWVIVDKAENGVMLMSKYILDASKYCENYDINSWEGSTVRNILNNSFYINAFTDDERSIIFNVNGDCISLMSYDIMQEYFNNDNLIYDNIFLATKATPYAKSKKIYVRKAADKKYSGNSAYWLKDSPVKSQYNMPVIEYNGYLSLHGVARAMDNQGIRPVLWLYWGSK